MPGEKYYQALVVILGIGLIAILGVAFKTHEDLKDRYWELGEFVCADLGGVKKVQAGPPHSGGHYILCGNGEKFHPRRITH